MLETYPTPAALADAAAQAVEARLADALAVRPRASLVGTGGRSPAPVYDRLAAAPIDLARVVVTLSDERCVPENSPDSNAGLAHAHLLQGPAAEAELLPLWPHADEAALAALMPFDAVILGMGEDGHVASLIPGDPGLESALTTDRLTALVPEGLGRPPLARITLTLSALSQSRAIFLLIAGEAKREVIERAQAGADLPVGRLLMGPAPVRVFWTPG